MPAPLPKLMKRGYVKTEMGCQAPPPVLTDFPDYFTMWRDVNLIDFIKQIPSTEIEVDGQV